MGNRLFITGKPGVGKTKVLMRLVNELLRLNVNVTGFYCPEIRKGGIRTGFKIISIPSGKEELLATTEKKSNVKVGKYFVVLNENYVKNLENEIFAKPDVIAIDEIGPMELSVPSLKTLIDKVLESDFFVVAVLHRSIKLEGKLIEITENNRDAVFSQLLDQVLAVLRKNNSSLNLRKNN
ncbi:NTPase [Stygiolobus caldivivus]|uniref:Nucleoside-triphosphatase KN1_05730 n=1 Tax=Stygiolobus caldivivus TaxID=2824673 RepID=A0A8D5U5I9_9CREN|nr:NTPase [Stygiolobus caldivivus]BCU69276.1 AAA family ATPase [Stygiolobus caldivivus]